MTTEHLAVLHSRRAGGMTLLELIVAMALLALLAGLLPLALQRSSPAQRCAKAKQALVLRLRDLQLQAVRGGRPLQLTLQRSDLCIPGPRTNACTALRWTGITGQVRTDAGSASRTITWYPDGSASGGTIELHCDAHRVTLSVSALTGRVREW